MRVRVRGRVGNQKAHVCLRDLKSLTEGLQSIDAVLDRPWSLGWTLDPGPWSLGWTLDRRVVSRMARRRRRGLTIDRPGSHAAHAAHAASSHAASSHAASSAPVDRGESGLDGEEEMNGKEDAVGQGGGVHPREGPQADLGEGGGGGVGELTASSLSRARGQP